MNVLDQATGDGYAYYHGDCVRTLAGLPPASVHLTLTSIPFSNIYVYNDSISDMGNSGDDREFFAHFDFLVPELYRVTIPGRLCAVHCKQLVDYRGRDGRAGIRDFRGDVIRHMEAGGWKLHSEVTIWTDPVLEMQRTKAHGLLYKQLRADSSYSRQGLAEYLEVFRRWPDGDADAALQEPVTHTHESLPLEAWQRYASPVWMDIRRTRVLNVAIAADNADEKHACPLQLDVCDRVIDLWSNPGDVVLDPFGGVASVGHAAIPARRKFVGVELKESYWRTGVAYLEAALAQRGQMSLFDLTAAG